MTDHDSLERALHYHERTKHHLNAYARSLGYLDWATQPDPFRRFAGAPRFVLDHPPAADEPTYDALFAAGHIPPRPLDRAFISQLFYDSLALSAWKEAGRSRWSLRMNPSSGDLHPTEGYLIAGPVAGLSDTPGIYHYSPFEQALERRTVLSLEEWQTLAGQLPKDGVLVGLASIYWREAWKYGERAFRYCHHDAGHAIGTVSFAAAGLGWQVRLVESVADADLARLLCIHRQNGPEAEHPDCLLAVFPDRGEIERPAIRLPAWLSERLAEPAGQENRLSGEHHPWPVIDEVAEAVRWDGQPGVAESAPAPAPGVGMLPERRLSARRIIHRRRSAVDMDGRTWMDRAVFYHTLARVTPGSAPFPFQVLPWRPRVSLALFVHRVRDLEPGLYLLVRDPRHRESLRAALREAFLWQRPPACPEPLELYLLQKGDAREAARMVSCHQDIAADGAFSLGMLAEFEPSLRERGAWFYPRLFWETGLIGQVLYLEAEAAGLRGTGIGCFFDDAMHQVVGIADRSWQSLYHFTVGGPVEDTRLRTLEPYFHLKKPELS